MNDKQCVTRPGLRERKKEATRRALQEHALRLFLANGYDATTVDAIAEAAGVSHMTFFRYFPTKEDVILADDYDPLLATLIAARPPDEPAFDALRFALGAAFVHVSGHDRDMLLLRTRLILQTPALRARLWEQQAATEQLFARALADRRGGEPDLATRVVAAACLAAVTTALMVWVEGNGEDALPAVVDRVLVTLHNELGVPNGEFN
jgi:AcrR family transcriptional regulator